MTPAAASTAGSPAGRRTAGRRTAGGRAAGGRAVRSRAAGGRPADRGSAVVEFPLLGVVLLVPLVYLAVALATVQRAASGVTEAAREAGRAYVTGTAGTAAARAERAARLVLADRGGSDGVEMRYAAAGSDCADAGPRPWPLGPGAVFAVCVSRRLDVPAVPGFLVGGGTVTGRFLVRADEHRDHRPAGTR